MPGARQVGYVPFAPLGRGFLTATILTPDDLVEGDRRRAHPRFTPENMEKNVALLSVLEGVAAANGATEAQVALAWLLAQGDDIVPIPGSKRTEHLEENLSALDVTLSGQDLSTLNDAFRPGAVAGPRYTMTVRTLPPYSPHGRRATSSSNPWPKSPACLHYVADNL